MDASCDASKTDLEKDIEIPDDENVMIKMEKASESSEKPHDMDDDDVIMLPQEEPVVTEILDETENIAEETDKVTTPTDDDVMIQEPKIETQLVPDDDDDDDNQPNPSTSDETSQPSLIVKIKEEPQDDGYEDLVNEEDAFVEVTAIANDELMHGEYLRTLRDNKSIKTREPTYLVLLPHSHITDEAYTNSPKAPFQPAQDENAMFDESSLMMMPSPSGNDELSRDMDDDNNSRPESSGALIGGNKKLKIVLSSLAQTNLSNKNLSSLSNVNDQNENSNLDSVNKLDSNSVELQSEAQLNDARDVQDEPEIEFQVKPQLQGVKLEKNLVPVKRGFENSGLCSIM